MSVAPDGGIVEEEEEEGQDEGQELRRGLAQGPSGQAEGVKGPRGRCSTPPAVPAPPAPGPESALPPHAASFRGRSRRPMTKPPNAPAPGVPKEREGDGNGNENGHEQRKHRTDEENGECAPGNISKTQGEVDNGEYVEPNPWYGRRPSEINAYSIPQIASTDSTEAS